jgi:O-antigen/teichoic acid export membrane protein
MTSVLPRDAAPARGGGPAALAARIGRALRSRAIWFVFERYSSIGFGFLLTATLTRGTQLDQLAEYLSAFALISVFEPLFAASISSYLLRLIREASSEAAGATAFRTVFWTMQGVAVVFVGLAFAVCLLSPGEHLITALFFVQILFSPWKLFSAPLYARDEFIKVTPVQVRSNLAGGVLRVAVALATHNLFVLPLLMCFETLVSGPIIARRSGVKLFGRPSLSPVVLRAVVRQLPSLMGVMLLVCLFYRSPVMLARLALGSADVVRVALAMQVITAAGVIQNALADSLIGPLAHALDQDGRFRQLLSIGSAVAVVYGLVAWAALATVGEPLLTFAFGRRAMMIGPIVAAIAPICMINGLVRLSNTAINLRARPVMMVVVWAGALAGQAVGFLVLSHWRLPIVVAAAPPLSLAFGAALGLLPAGSRVFMLDTLFGFRRVLFSPREWREAIAVMLSSRGEAARVATSPQSSLG